MENKVEMELFFLPKPSKKKSLLPTEFLMV